MEKFTHVKQGVEYSFTEIPDWFARDFPTWEPDTFKAFDRVKCKSAVALDIGAWIGSTAIWLAHHFSQVVCVEGDQESVKALRANLDASNVKNAVVVPNPIHNIKTRLVFGPNKNGCNEGLMNMSTSQLKDTPSCPLDYEVETVTLAELPLLDQVGFIKCDIEGGEEMILEDVLSFCKTKNIPALISFHVSWWKNPDVTRYESLMHQFVCRRIDTFEAVDTPCSYVAGNPFGTLLFENSSS
jgi:FkbM family methyltransferase